MRQALRPGGRSERVQRAVHAAVRALAARLPEAELSIPLIAAEAGVTPSTVYRRWGCLTDLMADVAVERLRPEGPPADAGSLRGDLSAWLEAFAEEMGSGPGRAMMRDILAASAQGGAAARCCGFSREQLAAMVERAAGRGEATPTPDQLLDLMVAPVMYRLLFLGEAISAQDRARFIDAALRAGAAA